MSECILGGGMAGLIWGACHPDSLIIEKGPIGGMVHNNLGPMMIKHTLQSEEFVRSLGMDVRLKEIMVGYTYGLQRPLNIQPEGFKEQYVSHSRKIPISEVSNSGHKSMMNSSQNTFLIIELNMQKFIDAMVNKIVDTGGHILKGTVSNIRPRNSCLFYGNPGGFENKVAYDSLVSTLPMYVLKRLIYEGYDDESNSCFPRWSKLTEYVMHKVFVSLKGIDAACMREKFACVDFAYNVPSDDDYVGSFLTRVILIGDDPVLEFTIPTEDSVYMNFLQELNSMLSSGRVEFTVSELMHSMIRRNVGIKECECIKMVGRYAQWDHGIRLHTVIAEAMK